MAAALIPSIDGQQPHLLRLPDPEDAATALEEVRYALGTRMPQAGTVVLDAGAWSLRLPDLRDLREMLAPLQLELVRLRGRDPETLVAAAAFGLEIEPAYERRPGPPVTATSSAPQDLLVHRGTLRSGDHLQAEASVLLLGDVNPGARISAIGNVLVWGRLRGVAHAGVSGNRQACIVALQLRPLQLRIADAVARGPADLPPRGLAEEARLVEGEIRIAPATPEFSG